MKNIAIFVLAFAVLLFGWWLLLPSAPPFQGASGTEHTNLENFYAGLRIGAAKYRPALNLVATTTVWNPGSLAGGAATSTEVAVSSTVTGFVTGFCSVGGFTAASTTAGAIPTVGCFYTTSTAIISLANVSGSVAIDLATATVTIYQLQF